ncbi:DUF6705 family protein [Olleya namhaensis]|uniref:DUF6705 family protein n=1 Tax=Olleya namhaensis TaxID=1144750 RepID=UPI00249038BA|nr:DUF6705 family protein [Olleya namhaensis]
MKKIIYISIFLLTSISYAQTLDLNLTKFAGNWEYNNGTETFKVELFIEQDYDNDGYHLSGDYQLINNTTGEVIYQSNKTVTNDGTSLTLEKEIFLKVSGNNLVSGSVQDNVLYDGTGNSGTGTLLCNLAIEIQDSCNTCPTTATWKAKRVSGVHVGEITTPNIPTDIILTKTD